MQIPESRTMVADSLQQEPERVRICDQHRIFEKEKRVDPLINHCCKGLAELARSSHLKRL